MEGGRFYGGLSAAEYYAGYCTYYAEYCKPPYTCTAPATSWAATVAGGGDSSGAHSSHQGLAQLVPAGDAASGQLAANQQQDIDSLVAAVPGSSGEKKRTADAAALPPPTPRCRLPLRPTPRHPARHYLRSLLPPTFGSDDGAVPAYGVANLSCLPAAAPSCGLYENNGTAGNFCALPGPTSEDTLMADDESDLELRTAKRRS